MFSVVTCQLISIHALTKSATLGEAQFLDLKFISIHALTKSATTWLCRQLP